MKRITITTPDDNQSYYKKIRKPTKKVGATFKVKKGKGSYDRKGSKNDYH